MYNSKILIELVPRTSWFTNVRSQVSSSDWDWLRKEAYKAAEHQCTVCNAKGRLEAHEIWHYDDKKSIQKLHSIAAVCKSCHELYHLGFASINGKLPKATAWLAKINGWTIPQTKEYIDIVFEIWFDRSKKNWTLDLSLLDSCDIQYEKTPNKKNIKF